MELCKIGAKILKILVSITLFLITFLFLNSVHTTYHEETHLAVCKYFGYINASISYGFLRQSGNYSCFNPQINSDTFLLAQSMVEIRGYHNISFLFAFAIIIALMITIIIFKNEHS